MSQLEAGGLLFRDKKGREWNLKLDAGIVDDVYDATGEIDLYKIGDSDCSLYVRIMGDIRILTNVVWQIVKPQAGDMTPRQFKELLDGRAQEEMGKAFTRAIADFSPRRLGQMLLKGMKKTEELESALIDRETAKLEMMTLEEAEAKIKSSISAARSSNGPASSA